MATKEVRTTYGWKLDTNSQQQVINSNNAVKQSIQASAQAANDSKLQFNDAAEAARALGLNAQQMAQLTSQTDQLATATDRVAASAVNAATQEQSLATNAAAAAETQNSLDLSSARQAAGRAGGLLATVGASQAASAVSSTLALTEAFGPFGIAAAAGVLALKEVTSAEQQRTEAAKGYIEALAGTAGETSADLQKQIDQEKAHQASIQGGIQSLKDFQTQLDQLQEVPGSTAAVAAAAAVDAQAAAAAAAARAAVPPGGDADQAALDAANQVYANAQKQRFEDAQQQLTDLNAKIYDATKGAVGFKDGLGTWIDSSDALNAALKAGQDDLDTSTGKIAFLGVQLDSAATKANDAAAAAEAYAKGQVDNAQYQAQVNQMTKAQRDERANELLNEMQILDNLKEKNKGNQEAQDALGKQLDTLGAQYDALTSASATYADVLEAEKNAKQADIDASNATQDGLKELQDLQTQLNKANEDAAQKLQALTDAQTEHGDKLKEIEDNRLEKRAEAQTKADDDVTKAQAKAQADLEKQAEAHRKRIQQIEDQYNQDNANAVANRDALAALQAKQTRDKALKNENDADETRRKEIQDALDTQTKTIRDNLKEQQRLIDKSASDALASEKQRYDKERQQRQQAYDKALEDQRALNAAIEVQRSLNAFRETYWVGVVTNAYDQLHNQQALLANSANDASQKVDRLNTSINTLAFTAGYASNGRSGNRLTSFDSGGFNLKPGLFYAGVPEAHIPLSQMRGMARAGGISVALSLQLNNANIDTLWPPIRKKILDAIRTPK